MNAIIVASAYLRCVHLHLKANPKVKPGDVFWLMAAFEFHQAGGVDTRFIGTRYRKGVRVLRLDKDPLVVNGYLDFMGSATYMLTPLGSLFIRELNDAINANMRETEDNVRKAIRASRNA